MYGNDIFIATTTIVVKYIFFATTNVVARIFSDACTRNDLATTNVVAKDIFRNDK